VAVKETQKGERIMRINTCIVFLLTLMTAMLFTGCSKNRSLEDQLDDLEKIIVRYEPKFDTIEYGSEEYTAMITEWNKEIQDWGAAFERNRYEKDKDGKTVFRKEFDLVADRFYKLNNRMTVMVLAKIPKPEEPEAVVGSEQLQMEQAK
jgi:hypothetical protein